MRHKYQVGRTNRTGGSPPPRDLSAGHPPSPKRGQSISRQRRSCLTYLTHTPKVLLVGTVPIILVATCSSLQSSHHHLRTKHPPIFFLISLSSLLILSFPNPSPRLEPLLGRLAQYESRVVRLAASSFSYLRHPTQPLIGATLWLTFPPFSQSYPQLKSSQPPTRLTSTYR